MRALVLLITIIASSALDISASRIVAVHVGDVGEDTPHCGSSLSPCETIAYSIKYRLNKTGGTVYVNSSTPIVESKGENVAIERYDLLWKKKVINLTSIVVLREPSQRIDIVGLGATSPVIHVEADYFFFVLGKFIDTHITFINLRFVLNFGLFHMKSYSDHTRGRALTLSLKDSTIEHSKMNSEIKIDKVIYLRLNNYRARNCHLQILFENCVIQSLNSTTDRPYIVYIQTQFCHSELTMVNTTIRDNHVNTGFGHKVERGNGTTKLLNVTAYNNSGRSYLFDCSSHTNSSHDILIGSCTFTHNRVASLIAFLDYMSETKQKRIKIKNTHFEENDATHRVLRILKVSHTNAKKNPPVTLSVSNVTAKSNNGGVISIETKDSNSLMSPLTYMEVEVRGSEFESNIALVRGGAISLLTALHPASIKLKVVLCRFVKNIAGSTGGGVYSTGLTEIKDSTFDMNEAKVGGAVYFAALSSEAEDDGVNDFKFKKDTFNVVQNCIFVSKSPIFWSNANLQLSNVSMDLNYNSIESVELFKHDSAFNTLEIRPPFILNCRKNKIIEHKLKKKDYYTMHDTRFLSFLSTTCKPCGKGKYSISQGSARWVYVDGYTRGVNSYFNTTSITCSKCPMGGNCEEGNVRSRPNYWGYKVRNGIAFSPCPKSYCSSESEDINSCAANRTGDLCGQCVANKTLSVTLSCVDPGSCSSFLMILAAVFIPVLLILFYFNKENVVPAVKKKLSWVKKRLTFDKNEIADDEEEESDNKKSLFARLKLLFYFFQLHSLIYVGNKQGSFVKTFFLQKTQSLIGSITMLNLNQDTGNIANTICIPHRYATYVHYKLFSLLLKIIPIVVCIFSYVVLKLYFSIRRLCARGAPISLPLNNSKVLLKLQSTAFQILMLLFIPISSDLVQLLNCVYIVERGKRLAVLFGDASHICLQAWQYVPLLFLIMYVFPFCFALYIGSCFLYQNRFSSFSVMIIFPWSFVYYYFMDKYPSVQQRCSPRMLVRDAEDEEPNLDEVPQQELYLMSKEKSPTEPKEIPRTLNSSSKCFFGIIQENYNVLYWPTIVAVRNLAVAAVPLAFKYDYEITLSMTLVLFVYFSLLIKCQPFKDHGMTILEAITVSMLIFLGVISIINTTYLTSTDNNILYFLKMVDVLRCIFFFVPVLALVILSIVEKVKDGGSSMKDRSVKLGNGKKEESMESEEDTRNEENNESVKILDTHV